MNRFQREIIEVCEFYIDDDNKPKSNTLYQKQMDGRIILHNPTHNLIDYLSIGNVTIPEDTFGLGTEKEKIDDTNRVVMEEPQKATVTNHQDPFNMNDATQTPGVTQAANVQSNVPNTGVQQVQTNVPPVSPTPVMPRMSQQPSNMIPNQQPIQTAYGTQPNVRPMVQPNVQPGIPNQSVVMPNQIAQQVNNQNQ